MSKDAYYNEEVPDTPILNDTAEPVSMPRLYGNLQQATNSIAVSPLQDIQKAIDAIYALGGGEIRLQQGIYYPKSDITLKSQCKLIGESSLNTIIDFSGQAYSVIIPNSYNNISVRLPVLESMVVKNSSTHGVFIDGNTFDYIIRNIDSIANGGNGFYFDAASNGTIESCSASANTGYGYYIFGGTLNKLNGCEALNSTLHGLYADTTSHLFINDYYAFSNTQDGIAIDTSSYINMYGLFIVSNERYGCSMVASNWANVSNSTIATNTSDGIRIDSNSNRNRIISSNITSNGGWGVLINNADCDKNLLAFCDLGSSANTSGTISDGGTGTVSVNHIT